MSETITANTFPMQYLAKPVKAQELKSKVEGTIIKIAKDFPEVLIKAGKAQELRSKFTIPPAWENFVEEMF